MRLGDVAKLAGVTKVTVGMWAHQKKLRWTLSPRGKRYYDEKDVREFLAKHPRYKKRVEPVKYVDQFTTTVAAKALNVKTETVVRWARIAFPEKFNAKGKKSKWLLLARDEIAKLAELCDIAPDWSTLSPVGSFLTRKGAMQVLACTRRQIETWTTNRPPEPRLKSERIGASKRIRYRKSDLIEFAREHRLLVPGAAENVRQFIADEKLSGGAGDQDGVSEQRANHHIAEVPNTEGENRTEGARGHHHAVEGETQDHNSKVASESGTAAAQDKQTGTENGAEL